MTNNFTVASADQLRGLEHMKIGDSGEQSLDIAPETWHVNKGKLPVKQLSDATKAVRFTPSTIRPDDEDSSPGTEVFTHSRHASWSTSSPVSAIPDSLPDLQAPYETELLRPVKYGATPDPFAREERRNNATGDDILVQEHSTSAQDGRTDLVPDPTSHGRQPSGLLNSSRHGRKQRADLYFSPTDVTKSKIFFSSPKGSPAHLLDVVDAVKDEAAAAIVSRPTIAVPSSVKRVANPVRRRREAIKITPVQLDQLVVALAKCRMVQKHVRKYWWEAEDIPDNETVTSIETVSTPTLTTASTLYSRRNENFINQAHTPEAIPGEHFTQDTPASLPVQTPAPLSSSIVLTDPMIHGSPIRFISQQGHFGRRALSVGSCTFLNIPYGAESECSLHIHPPTRTNPRSRILLQCVNQVVDRTSGKRTHLLAAEIDVTPDFTRATLAELAAHMCPPAGDIEVVDSPTAGIPSDSPEIDWVALADDLQALAHVSDAVDDTLAHLARLGHPVPLLAELDLVRDQHQDFLVLRPTAYHDNGVPSSVRLPWVSRRLFHDWYQTDPEHGRSRAAEEFKAGVVQAVAKRGGEVGEFSCVVEWEETGMVVLCVPVFGAEQGRPEAWVCFVRGEVVRDQVEDGGESSRR